MTSRTVYLDNAATTPVLPEVRDAMLPYLGEAFGNPSSAHRVGRAARAAVEEARRKVATAIGTEPKTVFFTGGGTEADNLAVLGGALAARDAGRPFRVAVSAIEHKAVLGAAHAVEAMGGECIELPVDARGALDLAALDAALSRGVAVVSVMWVNNETGIVQDLAPIAERCRAAGVPLHTDGVQAFGKVAVDLATLPGVTLAVSAHKIGGPKGVGAIVIQDQRGVAPLIHGGGQQSGIRPGTENVPGIVGFGRAAEFAAEHLVDGAPRTRALREAFERRLLETISDASINGGDGHRAPHVTNVAIPGTDNGVMLMHLDLAGVCCSAGSACSTGSEAPSHVLAALGVAPELARASLRFSFDRRTTADDVDYVLETLPGITEKVRTLAAALKR